MPGRIRTACDLYDILLNIGYRLKPFVASDRSEVDAGSKATGQRKGMYRKQNKGQGLDSQLCPPANRNAPPGKKGRAGDCNIRADGGRTGQGLFRQGKMKNGRDTEFRVPAACRA
jgi:hypothetical protein